MAVKNYIVILLLLAAVFQDAQAQSRRADRPQVLRQAQTAAKDTASLMQYIVDENGDTVYLDDIEPVYKVAVPLLPPGPQLRQGLPLRPAGRGETERGRLDHHHGRTQARQAQPLYQHPPEGAVRDIRETAEESYGQPGQTAAEAYRPADRHHAIRDHQRVQGTGGGGFLAGHRQAVRLGHETALRPGRSRQADRGTGDPLSERGVQCPVPLCIRTESARAGGQVPAGRGAALISSRSPSKTAYSPPSTQHPRMTIRPPEGTSISPGVW